MSRRLPAFAWCVQASPLRGFGREDDRPVAASASILMPGIMESEA
jgi:hypothetical protein